MPEELKITLNPKARKNIEDLQHKMGNLKTIDVVRKAFALLDLVVDHQKAGGTIQLVNKDGSTEPLVVR